MININTKDEKLANISLEEFGKFSCVNWYFDSLTLKDSKYFGSRVSYFCTHSGQINKLQEKTTGIAFHIFRENAKIEMHNYDGIFIHNSFERQGFARELIEIMENISRKTNCGFIKINNVVNHNLWKHFGYSQIKDDKYYNLIN